MIYADNAATTRMSDTAIEKMTALMRECYGNPSSLYGTGQKAKEVLEQARADVASVIGAQPREILFTSDFTGKERVHELVAKIRSRLSTQLLTSGSSTALVRAMGNFSASSLLADQIGGIGFYRMLTCKQHTCSLL